MNYLQRKKMAFMSIVNQIKGFVRTVFGVPPLILPDCVEGCDLLNYKIEGNSVQDGIPTPDNPVEIESVGDYDEATEKYKIPITVSGDNGTTETAIYLDEPLRKVGDYADYIDFENSKVVRNIGAKKVNFSVYNFNATNKYLYLRTSVSDMLKDSLNCISDRIKQFAAFPGSANNNQLMVTGRSFYYLVKSEEDQQQYYIDLMAGTEIHYILEVPTEETIQLPTIPLFKGPTALSPNTTIQPSNMSATYYSTSKE